jgi:translocation and assembly module TamB
VPNGSFTALGRRFQIESALITETGGDIADPELEVKARYEKGSTVVFINVSGTARDPVIDLQSNPPMDQDAIAFFLATGRVQGRATQNGGGVDLSGAATSVAGSLLFGQVRKELADVLPVDVLTIEASGATISQASVGKYIGDQIFIGYRQRLTPAPNENTSEGGSNTR